MQYRSFVPPGLWQRTRWIRVAFLAGLALGLLLGWLFHGIISLVMQVGLVGLLVLPLLIIGVIWWRASRRPRSDGMTVMTWSGGAPRGAPVDVEDVPFTTSERRPRTAADVDAELDALLSERDRSRRGERR